MVEEKKEETTNAVLKEMIIGLTKITDDRLLNLKEGMAEIKTLVQGFVTKAELEEVKKDFYKTVEEIRKGFAQHNLDDKESFGGLSTGQEKISNNQQKMNNTIQRWGGALLLAGFALPIVIPIILHYIFKW